jgi:hypothetical protein
MTIPEDAPRFGASPSDMIAIEQAALDYMEGWFTGDAKRVRRALHPQLVKRTLVIDPESGKPTNEFYGSSAEQLVRYTEDGGESQVRIWSRAYVEYLQLGNFDTAGWKIVNILYTMTEGEAPVDEYKQIDFKYWVVEEN